MTRMFHLAGSSAGGNLCTIVTMEHHCHVDFVLYHTYKINENGAAAVVIMKIKM